MIPWAHVVGWRTSAPWITHAQVEQDLILSRALVAIFQEPLLAGQLAFRGGTALHKLHFNQPRRYSEDIDLVQIEPGGIGPIIDRIQGKLGEFLGKPRRNQAEGTVTLIYRMESEGSPVPPATVQVFLESIAGYFEREGKNELSSRAKRLIPLISEYYKRGVEKE